MIDVQVQMYNVKQFERQTLQLLNCKVCCICLQQVDMNYFIDNIHIGDAVYCKVNDLFISYYY